jgi:hypothetical protein
MAVETRTTEERIAHIEGILSQMNERVRGLEERIGNVEVGLDQLRGEMREELRAIRGEMRDQFRWLIGMWISVMLVVLGAIIAKG